MDTTTETAQVNNTPVTERKVIVSGNLDGWLIDQELTKEQDIIHYYRDSMNEGGTDANITDTMILHAVDTIGVNETPQDADVLRCEYLEDQQRIADDNEIED